mgnify:CR=1 FL=1
MHELDPDELSEFPLDVDDVVYIGDAHLLDFHDLAPIYKTEDVFHEEFWHLFSIPQFVRECCPKHQHRRRGGEILIRFS